MITGILLCFLIKKNDDNGREIHTALSPDLCVQWGWVDGLAGPDDMLLLACQTSGGPQHIMLGSRVRLPHVWEVGKLTKGLSSILHDLFY